MLKDKKTGKRYYFDWAASAPCTVRLSEDTNLYGNPSSKHYEGREAKHALEDARKRCAAVLNVPPETIFFTSGGTESNSIALFSNLAKQGKGRVIASIAEHSSVREGMETLERMGKPTGKIHVDSLGKVTPQLLEKALASYTDVRFISCMAVNNETGAVTDIAALAEYLRKHKSETNPPIHFHCDLVQAAGKIPVNIADWGIDSASISAHKTGGPRGIGLLYLRKGNSAEIFYKGGGQENGIRGGTENLQGALALTECLEKYAEKETVLREYNAAADRFNYLINSLTSINRCTILPQTRSKSNEKLHTTHYTLDTNFSPYILQAAFKDIPGEVMARALDDLGFAVSTGSACSSSSPERPVLSAMGIDEKLRIEGIRISQGYTTTMDDIEKLIDAIREVLKFL